MIRPFAAALVALALALPPAACGPSGPSEAEVAAQKKREDAKKAEEESLARRKAEREAAQKKKEEEEAKEAADIDALAVLPETLPKKLDKACDERAKAEDEFMLKHYEGEVLDKWNAAKSTQLGFAKQGCVKTGSIEVAACQVNAMRSAPTELKKKLPELLKRCIDKFGGGEAPAG
ncbi:MAG: hypothetical protein R3B09_03385 [Nannocystaceae bacterium]